MSLSIRKQWLLVIGLGWTMLLLMAYIKGRFVGSTTASATPRPNNANDERYSNILPGWRLHEASHNGGFSSSRSWLGSAQNDLLWNTDRGRQGDTWQNSSRGTSKTATHWVFSQEIDIEHSDFLFNCHKTDLCFHRNIPKIVHFVWFYPLKTFHFYNMVSVLSVQKFINPERILFWHDTQPAGPWWDFIVERVNITMKSMSPPTSVFGNKIAEPAHQGDVARLQILKKYGGIYLDHDMIILRRLSRLYKYPVTLGLETPHNVGNALIIAQRNATFLHLWHDTYRTFNDSDWGQHSLIMPLKLSRKHRQLIHIEEFSFYEPNSALKQYIYKEGLLWDWMGNYAMHLYARYLPKQRYDFDTIKRLNSTLGEVFRYIIYGDYSIQE